MIKVLDKVIADKIAAGEVIERPVSIVKELTENAVDAGAGTIIIEIKNGGKSYIRVTDDGCGNEADQVETAFLRHATSKINSINDLDAIETLGFRGEALASICAVSRTEMLTKPKGKKIGRRVLIHGGEIICNEGTGCPEGTTIIVTDLFYNTPARLKFMKSDGTESCLIIYFVSQMALAYKDIKFRLINNGNVLFSTQGDGKRLDNIARIYKSVDVKNLTPVNWQEGKLSLEGYISTPAQSKTSRVNQIFFVNGRVVNSKTIEKGLAEGYRERLFEGRYPVAYLFLNSDPADLDVNIHPNKREVRFDKEAEVIDFIGRAVKAALSTKEGMVNAGAMINRSAMTDQSARIDRAALFNQSAMVREDQASYAMFAGFCKEETEIGEDKKTGEAAEKADKGEQVDIKSFLSSMSAKSIPMPTDESSITKPSLITKPTIKPFEFDDLTVTGAIFNTYITATDENCFYLIDQHAAHERIFYEKLVGEYEREEKLHQPIMIPIMIDVSLTVTEDRFDWKKALEKMGFALDEFGQNTYRVTEIPTFMELSEAESFIQFFFDIISEGTDLKNQVVIDKLIMKSCKSAVKAHDVLTMEEIRALLKDLKGCVNPFSCPHGRPTFIKLSQYEIERLFKRIQ